MRLVKVRWDFKLKDFKGNLRYKGIREKAIKVDLQRGYEKVTLSGEVMLKDLKLVQG